MIQNKKKQKNYKNVYFFLAIWTNKLSFNQFAVLKSQSFHYFNIFYYF